ncbi:MAG: NAD(P)/FAD-dependent oxidoreductase [Myxococcota bacterium]
MKKPKQPRVSADFRRPPQLGQELTLELGLDQADDMPALRELAARRLRVPVDELPELVLRKRSIDARRGGVRFHLLLELREPSAPPELARRPRELSAGARVLIVGDGPTGLFCAYELACHGIGATVLDRGKPVQPRRHDLKALNRRGHVNPDSNYCFGEGGAGTYSDGKLYTRSHKRGSVRDVLLALADNGAPPAILTEARPHIGSNRLPQVVTSLRSRLEAVGSEIIFDAKVTSLLVDGVGEARHVRGVRLSDGREFLGDEVVIATGHSARDVFELLLEQGLVLEPKPFALGVRIEHPQPLINRIQYGAFADHPKLPNAAYRVAHQVEGRGVFSFCMCPGGWVVPASTEPDGLVVNGMSLSRRSSPHANSGLVVAIEPNDWERAGFSGPLGGVELQRRIERAAAQAGGGALVAPAVRASDFTRGRVSSTVPESSYIPGIVAADVAAVLDAAGVPLAARLAKALHAFGQRLPGYVSEEAVLIGVESRTSAPLRVVRDDVSLQARGLAGLYPAGEGAGYAGGIVSAALDGVRVAHAILKERGIAPAVSDEAS